METARRYESDAAQGGFSVANEILSFSHDVAENPPPHGRKYTAMNSPDCNIHPRVQAALGDTPIVLLGSHHGDAGLRHEAGLLRDAESDSWASLRGVPGLPVAPVLACVALPVQAIGPH